jgi:transposase
MPSRERGHRFVAYIRGEVREQTTMFSGDAGRANSMRSHVPGERGVCRRIEHGEVGFVRSEPAETGSPGYDARDLLKLYLYGLLAAGAVVAATVS